MWRIIVNVAETSDVKRRQNIRWKYGLVLSSYQKVVGPGIGEPVSCLHLSLLVPDSRDFLAEGQHG
jgi:hypothetical protein